MLDELKNYLLKKCRRSLAISKLVLIFICNLKTLLQVIKIGKVIECNNIFIKLTISINAITQYVSITYHYSF